LSLSPLLEVRLTWHLRRQKSHLFALYFSATITIPYATKHGVAKAGLNHFVKHLAREEGHNGIRANLVSPGAILTEGTAEILGYERGSKDG